MNSLALLKGTPSRNPFLPNTVGKCVGTIIIKCIWFSEVYLDLVIP